MEPPARNAILPDLTGNADPDGRAKMIKELKDLKAKVTKDLKEMALMMPTFVLKSRLPPHRYSKVYCALIPYPIGTEPRLCTMLRWKRKRRRFNKQTKPTLKSFSFLIWTKPKPSQRVIGGSLGNYDIGLNIYLTDQDDRYKAGSLLRRRISLSFNTARCQEPRSSIDTQVTQVTCVFSEI